jgi:hypothetical protein
MTTYEFIISEQKRLREKDAARAAASSLRREQEAKAADKRTKSNSPAVSASPPERKEDNNGDNENNTDEKSNDDVENRRNGGHDGGQGEVEMTHQRGEGGAASTVGGGCPLGEDDEPYDPASDYHNMEGNGRGNYSQIVVGGKNDDSEEQVAL